MPPLPWAALSVRKVRAQPPVGPRPRKCAHDRYEHHRNPRPDERNQRPRAASGQRPSHAEGRPTRKITNTAAEPLRLEAERLAVRATKAEPLDRDERGGGGQHRGADDAVQVESIEPEHLLDAKPRDHLRLHENRPERTAEQKVRDERHVVTAAP